MSSLRKGGAAAASGRGTEDDRLGKEMIARIPPQVMKTDSPGGDIIVMLNRGGQSSLSISNRLTRQPDSVL
jgi:hypothetical protein